MPALVAFILSALMQWLLGAVVDPDAYFYRLFRPDGEWFMSVVPGLIAGVFIWTLADLFLKFLTGRANDRDFNRPEIKQLPTLVGQEGPDVTLRRLRGWDRRVLARPVGQRMLGILHHLDSTDAQRAYELVRHQSDLDTDAAASGYRTVKLFIWAMPILGFIGTVLGISLAVGGFSTFLTTSVSIDEVDEVTAELGKVAGGLSFAFDTTLLGLLAGLITTVASSGVQSRDERLLSGLEELGLGILANAMPASTSASPADPRGAPSEEFDQMMQGRLEELSTQMDLFTQAVRSGMDGFLGEWAKLPPEVEKVAADLTGLRQHLTVAAKSTDQFILETHLLLEGLNEASSHMGTKLTTSIGSISQTVEGLGDSLQGVSETLAASLAGLSERVQSSESHLESGLGTLREAIDQNHRDSVAAVESQAAAERAMQQLSASISELGERLSGFRDAQAALAPVLSQLAGPLELRLMPTAGAPGGSPETTKDNA